MGEATFAVGVDAAFFADDLGVSVEIVDIGSESFRFWCGVAGAEDGLAAFHVRLKEDGPRFFGLAVSESAADAVVGICGKFESEGAVIENPIFVVVEELALVIGHVELGGESELFFVGEAGGFFGGFFGLSENGEEDSGEDCDDGDDDEEFD